MKQWLNLAQLVLMEIEKKRGRGRPKGSVNKSKDSTDSVPVSNLPNPNLPKTSSYQKQPAQRIYTSLSHTSLGNTELYNLYGIVIDASSPHPKKSFHRQLLKIIDPTMHYKNNPQDNQNGCVSVTFFAHNAEQLPQFKRVGDIIRIHRANIGTYKNYKTFSVNLAFGSSWVIFSGFDEMPPKAQGTSISEAGTVKGFFDFRGEPDKSPAGKYKPYMSATKEYTLAPIDEEMVSKYRAWLQDYFKNDFNYESTLYMNLNKVKEFIMNEQSAIMGGRGTNPGQIAQYPREYDLVVKIESCQPCLAKDVLAIMTGGKQPEIRIRAHEEQKTVEPVTQVRVSDTSQMQFELIVPQSLLPQDIKVGDVIRVKSVVASTHPDHRNVLVPTDHSNILLISNIFKLYNKFHKRIENTEFNLTDAILGVPTMSIKAIQPQVGSTDQALIPQKSDNQQPPYAFSDEVLEKIEIASTVGTFYKNTPISTLADVIFQAAEPEPMAFSYLEHKPAGQEKNQHRVQFQVVTVQPLNLFEVCQLYCSKCQKSSSFRTLNLEGIDADNQGMCQVCRVTALEPIFMLQMLVTDASLQNQDLKKKGGEYDVTQEIARVVLYSNGGLCNKFFNGISPTNLYRENTTRLMLERYIRQICRFNIFVDAIVEKSEVPPCKGTTLKAKEGTQTVLRLVSCRLKPL